ncbi:MAG: transglycosylase SLT domain-containing protein, partial [Chitinophagaceae bacterium]
KLSQIAPDTKKALENPAYSFKDLFETDGLGLGLSSPHLNPRAISFVRDYIDRNGKSLMTLKDWARPVFNMIDGIFVQHNLPRELKYLAVIESRLNPSSISGAGAGGPWQFMPATATRMGLKVNKSIDERSNYVKSTEAAAKYLTELYSIFDDWLLVIAAYNSGPGNVMRAIKKSGSRNFWEIQYYLPEESRNHVKKFIGTHYIFEGQGGLTTLTRSESDDHYGNNGNFTLTRNISSDEAIDAVTVTVRGKYNAGVIAQLIEMNIMDFNRYNPGFDKVIATANNSYELKLPSGKMESFNSRKNQILSESVNAMLNGATSSNEPAAVSPKLPARNITSGRL